MENKTDLKGIGGLLLVYTILILIVGVFLLPGTIFLLIKSDPFSIPCLVISTIYIVAIINLFKKSPKAILWNKIVAIVICLFILIITIGSLSLFSDRTETSLSLLYTTLITTNVIPLIVSIFFLIYWFKSKRVVNTFSVESVTTSTAVNSNESYLTKVNPITVSETMQSAIPNAKVSESSSNTNLANSAINNVPDSTTQTLVKVLFSSLIPLSSFMFVFTGFAALFKVPFAFVFSVLYVLAWTDTFNKNRVNSLTVLSLFLTTILSYISLLLNSGVVTDSPSANYLIPDLMGIPSSSFSDLFGTLSTVTLYYFFTANIMYYLAIKKGGSKTLIFIIPIIGLLILGIHFGKIFL